MAIIQKYQDLAGKWRVLFQIDTIESMMLKFTHNPSDAEVQTKVDTYLASDNHIYRAVTKVPIVIEDFKDIIDGAVIFIKTTNPTLVSWNTYMGKLSWSNASVVRWFMFTLATGLAARNDINLTDYTELQVLGKLKVWIIATPVSKLRKIIWGT